MLMKVSFNVRMKEEEKSLASKNEVSNARYLDDKNSNNKKLKNFNCLISG